MTVPLQRFASSFAAVVAIYACKATTVVKYEPMLSTNYTKPLLCSHRVHFKIEVSSCA